MALEIMKDSVRIIQSLSDYPNQEEGLTAQEMKEKFDEAGVRLQNYINGSVVPAVNDKLSASELSGAVADAVEQTLDGVTPARIGAAPAGYGYGGTAIVLKDSSNITSEEELNTELAKVYDAMKSGETKMITWIMYPLSSGWRWFGILSKSSSNNGSLIAHSAYNGGTKIVKNKNNGAWASVEWENPPMLPGAEYRTIERWNEKPVYKKLIEYTNPDAISGIMTLTIPHNITGLDMIVTASCTTKNYLLPYLTAGSSLCISAWNSTNLTMNSNSSWGAGRKWYIELRYTKTA